MEPRDLRYLSTGSCCGRLTNLRTSPGLRTSEAILAHEVSHVRRRDNLAAAMHMAVEAIFWFHPHGVVAGSAPGGGTRTRLR